MGKFTKNFNIVANPEVQLLSHSASFRLDEKDLSMADLDHHNAKIELLRINGFLEDEVILIGGLAVQRYNLSRSSKDIDIVCSMAQQRKLIEKAYPSHKYEVEEKQNDLRPDITIKNLETGARIFLGSKIVERDSYKYIDYTTFSENSNSFSYDDKIADKIRVPAPYILAFSKIISFIARRNSGKGLKDLDDFVNLTNHSQFSLNRFIAYVERVGANDYIRSFFEKSELLKDESEALRLCSPVRFQGIIPVALNMGLSSEIDAGCDVRQLIDSVNELSNSPVANELGRLFAAVNELQFARDVIRRNWDIRIGYDISQLSEGKIIETIEWEYELMNVRSHDVLHEVTLTHSNEKKDGSATRIYTVLPDGRRQEIEFSETTSFEGHHYKREKSELLIEPGKPYFVTLYYKNIWYVNSHRAFILNATTTKEPCLHCRIRFSVPESFQVSLLNRDIIEPNLIENVYDVRLSKPLLAEQKIEYVLETSK